ncbi:MAG: response regulator [Frankiaceae bacterium]
MRILGVDHNSVSRLVLRAMITSLGHECLLAADGMQAWKLLQRGGVRVVITDRMMPDMDGLQLCRLIRSELNTGYGYVILASMLTEREQVREGMLAGADDYLLKPLQRHELDLRLIADQGARQDE